MKKLLLVALAALTASSSVYANDLAKEHQCKISRFKAQNIACKRVPGTVIDVDLEQTKEGRLFWEIDVKKTNGIQKEVHVDGQSGAILSVTDD